MPLTIPAAIEAVIQHWDDPQGKLDEHELVAQLMPARMALGEMGKEEHLGAFAEIAAWKFMRTDSDNRKPWGLYWTPLATQVMEDGRAIYTPDVAQLDDDILTHWIRRADSAQHPLMAARYADLAWEIGKYLRISPERRPVCAALQVTVGLSADLPRAAIDGYIDAVERELFDDEHSAWHYLSRATTLVTLLNDAERKGRVKEALFRYHDQRSVERGEAGHMMWWRLHDIVERSEKALEISDAERAIVTKALQDAMDRHSDINGSAFDPHQAENAADRLARWNKDTLAERQKIVLQAGRAFEQAAEKANGMVAISWLEDLIPRYKEAKLPDDLIRVENEIRARSGQANAEMTQIEVPLGIKKEELGAWADHVAGDSMTQGLGGVAQASLIRVAEIEMRILAAKEHAPLTAWFPVEIKGSDGFTEATIGPTDSDMEGRSYWTVAEHFGIDGLFTHAAFQRIRDKHGIDIDQMLAMIRESPYFKEDKEFMLREGLSAWLAEDPIKAIHVLVPQVEAACREVLIAAGESIRRPFERVNGSRVIGFGEMLDRYVFKDGDLKDIGFHLRALYTEPRGLNLRNKLAHGMAYGGTLTMLVANMVIHSLLMIAVLVESKPGGVK